MVWIGEPLISSIFYVHLSQQAHGIGPSATIKDYFPLVLNSRSYQWAVCQTNGQNVFQLFVIKDSLSIGQMGFASQPCGV